MKSIFEAPAGQVEERDLPGGTARVVGCRNPPNPLNRLPPRRHFQML